MRKIWLLMKYFHTTIQYTVLNNLRWIFPSSTFVLLLYVISINLTSGGLNIGFDEASYILAFRDIANGKLAISPYTTPKVLPILALGCLYHVTQSLRVIAIFQVLAGFLLLYEIFRLCRHFGLSIFLSLFACSIFSMFQIEHIASGNATIYATWFTLLAIRRFCNHAFRLDMFGSFFLLCACLTRPEPSVLIFLWAAILAAWHYIYRIKVDWGEFGFLVAPIIIGIVIQLTFDRYAFGDWFYSKEQVKSFAEVQYIGTVLFPEFPIWDLPPDWLQLPASLDPGPLMNSGFLARLSTCLLAIGGALRCFHADKRQHIGIILGIFATSSLVCALAYKFMGLVLFPRFFMLLSIAICICISLGVEGLTMTSSAKSVGLPSIHYLKISLIFFCALAIWIAGIRLNLQTASSDINKLSAVNNYFALCSDLETRWDGKPYRMVAKNAAILAILLNRSITDFIPTNWVPILCNEHNKSNCDRLRFESKAPTVSCDLEKCEFILGQNNDTITHVLLPLILKDDYVILTSRKGINIWGNGKLAGLFSKGS